jgi:hypothetical protein
LAALEVDLLLSKRRTLELYVNYIELGKGIYGIGAAAEYHFGQPAARLGLDEYRRLVTIAASPLRYTMANFTRRRILSARYDYLLKAFPDPQTAPPPGAPPPPEVQSQSAQEPEGAPGQETAPDSGGGIQAGVVVPETQPGETLPEPLHQPANP